MDPRDPPPTQRVVVTDPQVLGKVHCTHISQAVLHRIRRAHKRTTGVLWGKEWLCNNHPFPWANKQEIPHVLGLPSLELYNKRLVITGGQCSPDFFDQKLLLRINTPPRCIYRSSVLSRTPVFIFFKQTVPRDNGMADVRSFKREWHNPTAPWAPHLIITSIAWSEQDQWYTVLRYVHNTISQRMTPRTIITTVATFHGGPATC